ncbi:hypothetical protein llap_4045 [Limosa lapponica baueri]|uniref:Uncharacterized protein n=1 Tax=Limosa lapponica baueri TaxID=1758121 RepID=A0A2I0UHZ6_LIMLA|nr:hypothetical protein llap_4045 [Limosa lapponica baueri]
MYNIYKTEPTSQDDDCIIDRHWESPKLDSDWMGAGFRIWIPECMDWDQRQTDRALLRHRPLKEELTLLSLSLYTEHGADGMEYPVGQFWVTCPVHSCPQSVSGNGHCWSTEFSNRRIESNYPDCDGREADEGQPSVVTKSLECQS